MALATSVARAQAPLSFMRRRFPLAQTWRPVILASFLSTALVWAGACDPAPRTPHAAPYGLDDFGDTIRLPAHSARIASLNPATTEILFALGAGARLVGRTSWDVWPDSARLIPDLGPGIRPNVEAVLAARPDLVFLYASADNRSAAQQLRAAGIATAAFRVDRIEQFDALTRLLGRVLGDSARGALVADSVRATLERARALVRGRPRPTVLIPAWDAPLLVIGGGSFMSQLVDIAGGRNVYDSLAAPSPAVTFEDIVRRDPDIVLTGPENARRLRARPQWRALRAVRDGQLLILDTVLVLRPGVRLGEAALSLVRLLHPEALP